MAIKLLPDLETQKRIADATEEIASKLVGGSYININYADLVALRNLNNLKKGALYRIMDYVTTPIQADTQSAGHQFDIIVQALDEKTLSEDARALLHEGDTYFANSKLETWKLKYALTHEAKYYEPSYGYEGKYIGIVNTGGQTYYAYEYVDDYYLLFNEEFSTNPDDIMVYELSSEEIVDTFSGWEGTGAKFFVLKPIEAINGYKGYIYELIDEKNNKLGYDFKNIKFKRYKIINILNSNFNNFLNTYFAYTTDYYEWDTIWEVDSQDFDYFYTFDDNGNDASLLSTVNNNEIGIFDFANNVVFFGNNVYSNTIGNNFTQNTIGNYFRYNTIGNNFTYNTIGNYFANNTIGNSFNYNAIGGDFRYNTIGNSFANNTIGNYFANNTIGNYFANNTIGNNFANNTTGNYFNYNAIGGDFRYNTIGNSFANNTIGNYFRYNTVDEDVRYIQFSVDGTFNNQIRYLYLKSGLIGASSNNRLDLYYSGLYHREYPTTFEIIANNNIVSSWEETPLTRAGKVKATKTTATWSDI